MLIGGDVVVSEGFYSVEAQEALGRGWIDWQTDVPADVRAMLDGSADLRSSAPPTRPIVIARAGRDEFSVRTDRGARTVPAWWVDGPELRGPVWVLDPGLERWSPVVGTGGPRPPAPTQVPPLCSPVEVDPSGKEITFSWHEESPQGEIIIGVEGVETDTAVSLAVIVEPKPPEPGFSAHTLQGKARRITAWLDAPLGSRVFTGLHGEALEIIPTGSSSQAPFPVPGCAVDLSKAG